MRPRNIRLRHLYGFFMILAVQTSLSLDQGGTGSQTCTSIIYFFMTEIISIGMMLRFLSREFCTRKLNGGDPLQLVPCLTAGSIQATIVLGYPQLRTEHGMLIGTLPFSGAELLQENLRKFSHSVGSPSQHSSAVCLLLPNSPVRMSGLHCLSKSFLTCSCSHLPLTLTAFSQSDSCFLEDLNPKSL